MKTLTAIILIVMFSFGCVKSAQITIPVGETVKEAEKVEKSNYTYDGDIDVVQFFTEDYVQVQVEAISETTGILYVFGKNVTPTVAAIGFFVQDGVTVVISYCYLDGIMQLHNFVVVEGKDGRAHYANTELSEESVTGFSEKLSTIYKEYMKKGN